MKYITPLLLLVLAISIYPQVKRPNAKRTAVQIPTPTPSPTVKPPLTEIDAITKDGKSVILRSDYTWSYSNNTEKGIQTVPIDYKKAPLDLEAPVLPKGFGGHDFDYIYDVLLGKSSFKDEFETTEKYLKKVSDFQALEKSSQFGILVQKAYATYSLSYNADTQVFSVQMKFEDKALFPFREVQPILDFDVYTLSSGMSMKGILVKNSQRILDSLTFKSDSEKAKEMKNEAKLLILFRLSPPFVYDSDNKEFSFVFGRTAVIRKLIVGEINGIWLINDMTAKIYQKIPVGS